MIGAWGELVFEVSSDRVRTFEDFSRTESGRWAKHDLYMQKPRSEFLGPDLGEISFKMTFNAFHGVNPIKELDKLIRYVRSGQVNTLVINNKRYGLGKYKIKSVSEQMTHFDNKGAVLLGSASVTMEEYL